MNKLLGNILGRWIFEVQHSTEDRWAMRKLLWRELHKVSFIRYSDAGQIARKRFGN